MEIIAWILFIYFIVFIILSAVWYACDWYQWLVHKKKDYKFPITAPNSWHIHVMLALIWPMVLYGYCVHFYVMIFEKKN